MNNRVRPSPNTKTLCPWYRFATNGLLLRKAHGRSRISSARCDALSAVAYPCALELRTAEPRRLVPLRRFAVIGAALIGEDGVRDVTTRKMSGRRHRQQVLAIRYPAPAVGLPPSYRFATIELHRRW